MLRALARLAGMVALAALVALPARAEGDPPARVGRLGWIEGDVTMRGPDAADWSPATVNYPVSTGFALHTAPGARAEIQVGSTAIRLDGGTKLEVVRLDDDATRLRLAGGRLNLRLWNPPEAEFAIETAEGRVKPLRAGSYRVDVPGDDDVTRVAVLEGEARVEGPHAWLVSSAGQAVDLRLNPASYLTMHAARTEFDDWARARDDAARAAETQRFVSLETTGSADLDAAGRWQQTPDYGPVWYPNAVPAGWAPYRYGHWAWIAPWGWTWIDDAPWGFAPFHYGRWVTVAGIWGWAPGIVIARPCYAPALVAFVGGSHWHHHHGRPAIGWVPLAPRERYVPHFAASARYLQRVNVEHDGRHAWHGGADGRGRAAGDFANGHAVSALPVDAMRRGGAADRPRADVPARAPAPRELAVVAPPARPEGSAARHEAPSAARAPTAAPTSPRLDPGRVRPSTGAAAPAPVTRPPERSVEPARPRVASPPPRTAAPAAQEPSRPARLPASADPHPRSPGGSRSAVPHTSEPARIAPSPSRMLPPVQHAAPPPTPRAAAPQVQPRAAPPAQHVAPPRQAPAPQQGWSRGRCPQGGC